MLVQLVRLLCLCTLLHGSPSFADPEKDATWLAGMLLSEELLTEATRTFRYAVARNYEEQLNERGVKLRDLNQFAAAIPDEALAPAIARYEAKIAALLMQTFAPDVLNGLAEFHQSETGIRVAAMAGQGNTAIEAALDPAALVAFRTFRNSDAAQAWEEDGSKVMFGLAFGMLGVWGELNQQEVDMMASFLVPVLEKPGMADFPNRILKRDILDDLRSGAP